MVFGDQGVKVKASRPSSITPSVAAEVVEKDYLLSAPPLTTFVAVEVMDSQNYPSHTMKGQDIITGEKALTAQISQWAHGIGSEVKELHSVKCH